MLNCPRSGLMHAEGFFFSRIVSSDRFKWLLTGIDRHVKHLRDVRRNPYVFLKAQQQHGPRLMGSSSPTADLADAAATRDQRHPQLKNGCSSSSEGSFAAAIGGAIDRFARFVVTRRNKSQVLCSTQLPLNCR